MPDSQRSPPLPRAAPPSLDPDARQFHPQILPPPRIGKKTKAKSNTADLTPEKAEIESLKIELSYARAQIIDLETKNSDKDKTIKIYSQKLKIFEENRLNSLDQKYFSTTSPNPHPSNSSRGSDCSCQIQSKISRNETNLKDLDLKITLELVNFKKRLEDIRNILGNANPPSSDPPPEGSTPEGNTLLPSSMRIPSSPTLSRPEAELDTFDEETDTENPDSNPKSNVLRNSLVMSTTSDTSTDFDTAESEYEFSDVDHLN